MDLGTLLAFCAAWGALVVLPGPDTALVAGLGMTRGRRPAVGAALGSCTALAIHCTAAGIGASALLASSAELFTVLKLAGAVYLCVLGLRLILAREPAPADDAAAPPSATCFFFKGVTTGVLNPKSGLFFLTFLPQFLDPDAPLAPQLALLTGLTVLLAALWHAALVVAAARLRSAASRPRVREVVERLTGTIFVVLASRLATATR